MTKKDKQDVINDQMLDFIESNIETMQSHREDSDSFYRAVLTHLMAVEKDMSTKTEFNDDREVFAASKLEFMGLFAGVPLAKDILNIIEKKRVSKERKGRKEIIMSVNRREEEQRILNEKMTERGMGMLNNG